MEFEFPTASWVWVGKSTLKSRLGRAVHVWGFFCWSRRVLSLILINTLSLLIAFSSQSLWYRCSFKGQAGTVMNGGKLVKVRTRDEQGRDLCYLIWSPHFTFLGSFTPFYKPSVYSWDSKFTNNFTELDTVTWTRSLFSGKTSTCSHLSVCIIKHRGPRTCFCRVWFYYFDLSFHQIKDLLGSPCK